VSGEKAQGPAASGGGGVLEDMEAPSPVLAVAFGGIAMSVGGIPPFEFFRVLNEAGPAKKLLLRDRSQSWYHRGVDGLAGDIAGVEAAIRRIVEREQPRRLVMLGASAGGYAALLFGRLLGADEIHAFGPQTFIGPGLRLRHLDHRWGKLWLSLMLSGRYQPRYGDLYRVFKRTPSPGSRVVVHYCDSDRFDNAHARRLGRHPDVELRRYEEGGHFIVKHLRDTGQLQPLLRSLLSSESQRQRPA
jgi:hypothetical protein